MAKKTTVDLTDIAQSIKDSLTPIFGLKNILSAGLLVFSRLSAEDQKQVVQEASGGKIAPATPKSLQNTIAMIKEMLEVEKQQPGTVFRVLSLDEQKIIDEFRQVMAPKTQK